MTTHLPPQDPPERDEPLPGEAELTALYRQLPQSEPSAALDAAVLRAAAQAVPDEQHVTVVTEDGRHLHSKPNSATRHALGRSATASRKIRPRWLIGLSSAATLALAAGLAWHMRELPTAAPMQPAAVSMQPAAPVLSPVSSAKVISTAPPAAMIVSAPKIVNTAPALKSARHVTRASASPPPPPIPEPVQMEQSMAVAPSPPAPAAPPAAPNDLRATRQTYAPAEAAAPTEAQAVMQERSNAVAAPTAKPPIVEVAPVPMSMPAPAPAPAPAPPAPPAPMAAAPALMPASVSESTAVPTADTTTAANANDTPAQELDKIRQLFAQGHDDDAQQRLTAFQKAHPQWPLPEDLRVQLRKP